MKRTRFKKDIVSEFVIPNKPSNDVVIVLGGMPGIPKSKWLNFFSKHGYWTFLPRYRGSWESDGEFLQYSPEQDALDVISGISEGFVDIGSGEEFKLKPRNIYLIGSSFGGPAALLAAKDPRVNKVVAFYPVVDWTAESHDEPLDLLYRFVKEGFGNGYRFQKENWDKLSKGDFYNPVKHENEIPGEKVLIIHAKDDETVLWKPVQAFAKAVNCKLILLESGGHGLHSLSFISKFILYMRVLHFLRH
jgi:dipeptidyl aminopeptidase/acylaminoacyl peptidase|tara:strand:+ start:20953 stop:21693 length:741 start_codon:yes stop_codon:yes gene_type:complete